MSAERSSGIMLAAMARGAEVKRLFRVLQRARPICRRIGVAGPVRDKGPGSWAGPQAPGGNVSGCRRGRSDGARRAPAGELSLKAPGVTAGPAKAGLRPANLTECPGVTARDRLCAVKRHRTRK